ncbi:hypothetical protein R1sor_013680 [Riccia sorocarpa]|uniref:Orc1-like AAA ATPase domain-containing protein n=1 Tax=Riccia sorocarpa TaxID=122646 RepID=A0ABD3HBD4_9MARC
MALCMCVMKQVNDAVFRAYPKEIKDWTPTIQIVFFHGLTRPEQEDSYIMTWTTMLDSGGAGVCWPAVWLPSLFSGAGIYLVSYDSSLRTDAQNGRSDLFLAAESVLWNLLDAGIGQFSQCPVILVGHDLGGLLIKKICCEADRSGRRARKALFLKQLKGIYFLAVPHSGLPLSEDRDQRSKIYAAMAELGEEVARLNHLFRALEHSWKSITVYATHAHETEPHYCLKEGSARNGADEFLSIDTDGEQITRPKDENSGCFPSVRHFIEDVLSEFKSRNISSGKRQYKYERPRLPFTRDPLYVPIEETIQKVREYLLTEKVVLLCGEAGIGKTSLVKYLALQNEDDFKNRKGNEAVFRHGCCFVECGPGAEVMKCIVIKILEETGCNPLALDTLSLTVREKRRTETREWLEILEHIHLYLERSGHGDTSTKYPRGFFASMTYAVERLTDGRRPEFELLYVISLLQGPTIHCTVIKSLTGYIAPHLENHVSVLLHCLEILTLVQRRDAGDRSPGTGLDEYVSINPSRQHYMLFSKKGPVESVREKIDSLLFRLSSSDRFFQALCLVYGESNTRATIAARRSIPVSSLLYQFRSLEAARELLFPFVPGSLHSSDKSATRRQMFEELVLDGNLQTVIILKVLKTPPEEFNASRVLVDLFLAMDPESSFDLLHLFQLAFYSLLEHFFEHREVVEAFHMLEGFIEGIICRGTFPDKSSIPVLAASSYSDDSFGPVDGSMWEELQKSIENTACIINRMYVSTAGSRPYLKLGPGAIEAMVTSLSAANSRTEEAQFEAVAIFAFTVLASEDPKSLFVFDAVESLLGIFQGNKETSVGSKADRVTLVRLSEILVMVALRHGFVNGLQLDANLLASNQFEENWLDAKRFNALNEKAITTLVQRALEFEHRSLSRCALRTITHMVCQLKAASWLRPRKVLPEVLEKLVSSGGAWKHTSLLQQNFAVLRSGKSMSKFSHEQVLSFLNHSLLAQSLVTYREGAIAVQMLTVYDSSDKLLAEFSGKFPPFPSKWDALSLDISEVLNLRSDEQHQMSQVTKATVAYIHDSSDIQMKVISVHEVRAHRPWADWVDWADSMW